MCLSMWTPKTVNFPFETNGQLMVLGVQSLKHIRVFADTECNLEELTALLDDNNDDDDSGDGCVTSNTSELEKVEKEGHKNKVKIDLEKNKLNEGKFKRFQTGYKLELNYLKKIICLRKSDVSVERISVCNIVKK